MSLPYYNTLSLQCLMTFSEGRSQNTRPFWFLLHVWQPDVGEWCQVDYLCFLTGRMKCHLCLVSVSCGSLVDSCDDMVSFEMVSDTSRRYNFTIGRVVVQFSVRIIAARVFPSLPKITFPQQLVSIFHMVVHREQLQYLLNFCILESH